MISLSIKTSFMQFISKLVSSIEGVETEKEFGIRIAVSLALFILALIFRKQIASLLVKLLSVTIARKSDKAQEEIKDSLLKPLSLMIVILFFFIAFEIIAPSGELRLVSVMVLKIGAVISIGWAIIRYLNDELYFFTNVDALDSKPKKTICKFISNISKFIILFICIVLILEFFGIKATRIFATLGIGGLVIAFACKDTVENMVSGFIVITDRPFHIGDLITYGSYTGYVENITIRTTRIRNLDGKLNIIPNSDMANHEIVNWSNSEKRLIEEKVCVNYKHSTEILEKAMEEIRNMLKGDSRVYADDIRIDLDGFDEHGKLISIFFYINLCEPKIYALAKSELLMKVCDIFDKNGIELSFGTTNIRIEK